MDKRKLTEQETCYLNPRTHKVHNGNCRYADSALIKSSKDVIFQGNKVCKVCDCENEDERVPFLIEECSHVSGTIEVRDK